MSFESKFEVALYEMVGRDGCQRGGVRMSLAVGRPSVEQILNLYRKLTGREPTPVDLADLRQFLDSPPARN